VMLQRIFSIFMVIFLLRKLQLVKRKLPYIGIFKEEVSQHFKLRFVKCYISLWIW